jgi:hypothetical protein
MGGLANASKGMRKVVGLRVSRRVMAKLPH